LAADTAQFRGLDRLILVKTGMPMRIADDPLTCVVIGTTGKVLDA
jgi:actin-like ATPase involved in cell morphogenesis